MPLVSVVLTTYNSATTIDKVLDALAKQDFPLKMVELIIVDGGSKDETLDIVKEFIENHGHKFMRVELVIHDKNYGVSRARNDGIRISQGKYILILDSDVCLPAKGLWKLITTLDKMKQRELKVAGVKLLHVTPKTLRERNTLEFFQICRYFGKISEFYSIADVTLLDRKAIDNVGFYREDLGPPFCIYEDWEYGLRFKRKGYKILVIGDTIAIHKPSTRATYEIEKTQNKYNINNFLFHSLRRIREYFILTPKCLIKVLMSADLKTKVAWFFYAVGSDIFITILILSILGTIPVNILLTVIGIVASAITITSMFLDWKCPRYIILLSVSLIILSRILRVIGLHTYLISKYIKVVTRTISRLLSRPTQSFES